MESSFLKLENVNGNLNVEIGSNTNFSISQPADILKKFGFEYPISI